MSNGRGPSARVAQAQGMVSVQAACSIPAALVLMKQRARDSEVSLEDIAVAVVERTIRFDG